MLLLDRPCSFPALSLLLAVLTLGAVSGAAAQSAEDGDGIPAEVDNCRERANPSQLDTDGDGFGNACDCDFDGDGACDIADFVSWLPDYRDGSDRGIGSDMDGDGAVGIPDFELFLAGFVAGAPGPGAAEPPPPTFALIEEALAAGEIDAVDALRFKVFAVFGDPRLPDAYRGAGGVDGTSALYELATGYGTLPPAVQQELRPFLLPPDAAGSWYALREAVGFSTAGRLQTTGDGPALAADFGELDVTNAAGESVAVVKWPAEDLGLFYRALQVREALASEPAPAEPGIWDKLVTLMGRRPPSDEGLDPGLNGGDGRYDIYLHRVDADYLGTAIRHGSATSNGSPAGDGTSFAILDVQNIEGEPEILAELEATTAHELMHAIQFSFERGYDRFLGEATATWAEHFVFPDANTEHVRADLYLETTTLPLDDTKGDREYGAYLYFFHAAEMYGDAIIRAIWENIDSDPIAVLNFEVPGGFAENWADFLVAAWNDHLWDVWENIDGLQARKGATLTPIDVPNTSPDQVFGIPLREGGLAYLSAGYVHARFDTEEVDNNVRSVLFANGLTFELQQGSPGGSGMNTESLYATRIPEEDREGLHVIALVKQRGEWTRLDLTDVAFAPFCQEVGSESLEELVLIVGSARWEQSDRSPVTEPGLDSKLFLSNAGCGAWEGTATYEQVRSGQGGMSVATAEVDLSFEREPLTLEQIAQGAGQIQLGPSAPILPRGAPGVAPLGYEVSEVSGSWEYGGTLVGAGGTCEESAGGELGPDDLVGAGPVAAPLSTFPFATGSPPSGMATDLYRSLRLETVLLDIDTAGLRTCQTVEGPLTMPFVFPFEMRLQGEGRDAPFDIELSPGGDRIQASWNVAPTFEQSDTVELDLRSGPLP